MKSSFDLQSSSDNSWSICFSAPIFPQISLKHFLLYMFLAVFSSSSILAHASFICFHGFHHHSVQLIPSRSDLSLKPHTRISKLYIFVWVYCFPTHVGPVWHLNHYLCLQEQSINALKNGSYSLFTFPNSVNCNTSQQFPKLETKGTLSSIYIWPNLKFWRVLSFKCT